VGHRPVDYTEEDVRFGTHNARIRYGLLGSTKKSRRHGRDGAAEAAIEGDWATTGSDGFMDDSHLTDKLAVED